MPTHRSGWEAHEIPGCYAIPDDARVVDSKTVPVTAPQLRNIIVVDPQSGILYHSDGKRWNYAYDGSVLSTQSITCPRPDMVAVDWREGRIL